MKKPATSEYVLRLIERIQRDFPLPIRKPEFWWSSTATANGWDIKVMRDIYRCLPLFDWTLYSEPGLLLEFSAEIRHAFAQTYLIDKERQTLGLDPLVCGLALEPRRSQSFWTWIHGATTHQTDGDSIDQHLMTKVGEAELKELDTFMDLCTINQRETLLDYLLVWDASNPGLISDWANAFQERYVDSHFG